MRTSDQAHAKGVIHLDVKPANILIDEERTPHLTEVREFLDWLSHSGDRAGRGGIGKMETVIDLATLYRPENPGWGQLT